MRIFLTLLTITTAFQATAEDRPKLLMEDGLRIAMPFQILEIPEIQNQLESGLTTTVLLSYRLAFPGFSSRAKNTIQVQIRFEPWEEVFFLEWMDAQQVHKKHTVQGWSGLTAWWSAQRWLVWQPQAEEDARKVNLRLTFELVPFSQADQDRAMRLFVNQSRRVAPPSNQSGSEPATPVANAPSQVVNLLMQTASKSKPTIRFQWTLNHQLQGDNP